MRHPLTAVHGDGQTPGDEQSVCHLNVGPFRWGLLEDTPTPKLAYRPMTMSFYVIRSTPKGLEAVPLPHDEMSAELLEDWLTECAHVGSEDEAREVISKHFSGVRPEARDTAAREYAIKADLPRATPAAPQPVAPAAPQPVEPEAPSGPAEAAEPDEPTA